MENNTKIFFFTIRLQSSRRINFGKEIATRVGFICADTEEQAREKIWDKFGSDNAYSLRVWEVENSEMESVCVYYK